MKNMVVVVAVLVLLLPFVSANVVIHQVYYDPIGSETGGEAVELQNIGSESVDISGWVIATPSSDTDAIFPQGAFIRPGETYLVADVGWSEKKDNVSWRAADTEQAITLGNTNGGVALVANGEVVDAVGWGEKGSIEEKFFEGELAQKVPAGHSLVRLSDSGDNEKDFVGLSADFTKGLPVPILADISIEVPTIELSKKLTLSPKGELVIKNNGESQVRVYLTFNALVNGKNVIPANAVIIEGPSEVVVGPKMEVKIPVRVNPPSGAVPGKYSSTVRVRIER